MAGNLFFSAASKRSHVYTRPSVHRVRSNAWNRRVPARETSSLARSRVAQERGPNLRAAAGTRLYLHRRIRITCQDSGKRSPLDLDLAIAAGDMDRNEGNPVLGNRTHHLVADRGIRGRERRRSAQSAGGAEQ